MRTPSVEIRQSFDLSLQAFLPVMSQELIAEGVLKSAITDKDVAWPNAKFTPNVNKIYLRPNLLRGNTGVASLGTEGFERLLGIYQISVFGVKDKGVGEISNIARALVEHFRGGTKLDLGCFEVTISTATDGTVQEESDRPMVPVSVNWYCYVAKGL